MNKRKYRITAAILSALIICNIFVPCCVFAQSSTITISDKEDFIRFSQNCTLDTWSQGKTVNLACDIDLENSETPVIPTFGGTFNGNGYTISGINITKYGSYLGLFRYVQQGGKITKLNIQASVTPNGSKSFIGGIAGENCGIIEQCNFDGTVKGENVIGGIAGNNADSGQIISCSSSGDIIGENSAGGIAGKNEGLILKCTNNALVNTEYEEKKNELEDVNVDTGAFIENYKISKDETEESSVLGHTDTGGITGYTSGVVQGCINNGAVGYQHIGYNVGGISGRQSGYLLGCTNYGFIQGRKDVGGIVGQMEPYILLHTSENNMKNIQSELNSLHSMVDSFIADTDYLGSNSRTYLDNISKYTGTARDNAEVLSNSAADFVNDNISEINSQTALIFNTLDKLEPMFDDLGKASENVSFALEGLSDVLTNTELDSPDFNDEIDNLTDAADGLSKAHESIKKVSERASNAANDLDDAIELNNQAEAKKALKELSDSIGDLIASKRRIKENIEKIETILTTKPELIEQIGINAKQIAEYIKSIKNNIDTTITSLQTIEKSIYAIARNTEINFNSFRRSANEMVTAIDYLGDAVYYITESVKDISDKIGDLSDAVSDYADDVMNEVEKMKNGIANSLDMLSYSMEDVKEAADKIGGVISDFANEEPAEFIKLGDDAKDASSSLFDSLTGISAELELLKGTLTGDTINRNLSSINNQFNVIMNLMIDEVENISETDDTLSDRFLDVSDENISAVKQGKVADSVNYGRVEADRNTGGITGAMAIEYTKDPEDDIEKPDKFNFTYEAKAILYRCINDGRVAAKKDCAGGVVGYEEIGTVYGCENYADTESSNGNYVGGIAGKGESSLWKSFSKCKLAGNKYVGGIAGKAKAASMNYTIVTVSGEEYIGSVCGDCEDKSLINSNYYVDNGLGAVDGISYKSRAESVTFDTITHTQGIPDKFVSFKADFIVEGEVIETQNIKYGDETKRIICPDIPEKEGYFGTWQKPQMEYVTGNIEIVCEYKPYITLISSDERNDNGKLALALAEGEFTDEAKLNITVSEAAPPDNVNGSFKVYDISISNADIKESDFVTLRILNENKDKVTVWQKKDGNWEQTETSGRGKYTILQTQGIHNIICIKYSEKNINFIWLIFIVLAAAVAFVFLKKKKKK